MDADDMIPFSDVIQLVGRQKGHACWIVGGVILIGVLHVL